MHSKGGLFALFWHLDRVFLITAISAGYYSNETVTIHLTAICGVLIDLLWLILD